MVEMNFQVLLLFLAIVGLFTKHYFLEEFLRIKVTRTGQDLFRSPAAIFVHCGSHGILTTIVLFAFWGWASALIGLIDAFLVFTVKYWHSRTDAVTIDTKLSRLMENGLEVLIFELFYVSMAFLAFSTHIKFTL